MRMKFLLVIFAMTLEHWVKSTDQIEKSSLSSSRSSDRCPKLTIDPPPKDVSSFVRLSNAVKSKSNNSSSSRKKTSPNSGDAHPNNSSSGRQSDVVNSDDRNGCLPKAKTPVPAKRTFRKSASERGLDDCQLQNSANDANSNEDETIEGLGFDQVDSPESARNEEFQKSHSFNVRPSGLPPRDPRQFRRNLSMESVSTSSPRENSNKSRQDSPVYSPFSGYASSAIRSPGGPYGGSSTTVSASRSTTPGSAYEHSPTLPSPSVPPPAHHGSPLHPRTTALPRSKMNLSQSSQNGNSTERCTDPYYSPGSSSTDVKVVSPVISQHSPLSPYFTDDSATTVYPKSTPPGSSVYRRTPVDSSPDHSPGERGDAAILNARTYNLVLAVKRNARRRAGSESSVNKSLTSSSKDGISINQSNFDSPKATRSSFNSQTFSACPHFKEIQTKSCDGSPENNDDVINDEETTIETSKEINTINSVGSCKRSGDEVNLKGGRTESSEGSPRSNHNARNSTKEKNDRSSGVPTENKTIESKGSPKNNRCAGIRTENVTIESIGGTENNRCAGFPIENKTNESKGS